MYWYSLIVYWLNELPGFRKSWASKHSILKSLQTLYRHESWPERQFNFIQESRSHGIGWYLLMHASNDFVPSVPCAPVIMLELLILVKEPSTCTLYMYIISAPDDGEKGHRCTVSS